MMAPIAAMAGAPNAICPTGSLGGDVIVTSIGSSTVEVTLNLPNDSTIQGYTLSRHDCSHAQRCSVRLLRHRVTREESSSAVIEATMSDTAPPGTWTYRLDLTRRQASNCHLDSAPIVVPDPTSCLEVDLCEQLAETFSIELSRDGSSTVASWMAWSEGASSSHSYSLTRSNTTVSGRATEVALVDAVGACGDARLHRITDTPDASSSWSYRLALLDGEGFSICAFDAPR